MAGMDAGPGTDLGGLGFWLTAWVVMMAAMMFPSIAPMVVMYARIEEGKRQKGQRTQAGATAIFVGGYLLVWAAVGLLAYAIFDIGRSLDLGFLAWDSGGPYVAGGVIIAAASRVLGTIPVTAAAAGATVALRTGVAPSGPTTRPISCGRVLSCTDSSTPP